MQNLIAALVDGSDAETTADIVDGIRRGDAGRFSDLYVRSAPALAAWAALRIPPALRSRLDPEDVVQEVWSRAFAAFPNYDPSAAPFRAWLFGIARHVLLKAFRTLREQNENPGSGGRPAPEDVPAEITSLSRRLSRSEDVARIITSVLGMEEPDRNLFMRHGLEGVPLGEVAGDLGITRDAAKKRWLRLKERLVGMAGETGSATGDRSGVP